MSGKSTFGQVPAVGGGMMFAPMTEWLRNWSILGGMFRDAFDNWFQVNVNVAGDPAVEREVGSAVASSGKQLGIIEEALLEIADEQGQPGEKVERLRRMVAAIEWVKEEQKRRKS